MKLKRTIGDFKVLVISLLIAAAGCVMLDGLNLFNNDLPIYRVRPIKFNHTAHAKGTEADTACVDCHTKADSSDEAGMPSARVCRNCHDTKEEIEEKLKPFAPDGKKIMWTDVTQLPEDVTFSHKLHYEKGAACEDCHHGIEKSKAVSADLRNSKDDCIKCHAEDKISGDCDTCHEEINQEWEPESHLRNWKRFHGQVVRAGLEPPFENRCSLCHTDDTCSSCHQDEEGKPQNHTSHWRHRGHGIAAGMDRTRCATCHQTDYCDRCHQETEPRSHRGAWKPPYNKHCYSCHLNDRYSCTTCHGAESWHLSAPSRPQDEPHLLFGRVDCRTCHGKYYHPDNGDRCEGCHR